MQWSTGKISVRTISQICRDHPVPPLGPIHGLQHICYGANATSSLMPLKVTVQWFLRRPEHGCTWHGYRSSTVCINHRPHPFKVTTSDPPHYDANSLHFLMAYPYAVRGVTRHCTGDQSFIPDMPQNIRMYSKPTGCVVPRSGLPEPYSYENQNQIIQNTDVCTSSY